MIIRLVVCSLSLTTTRRETCGLLLIFWEVVILQYFLWGGNLPIWCHKKMRGHGCDVISLEKHYWKCGQVSWRLWHDLLPLHVPPPPPPVIPSQVCAWTHTLLAPRERKVSRATSCLSALTRRDACRSNLIGVLLMWADSLTAACLQIITQPMLHIHSSFISIQNCCFDSVEPGKKHIADQ